MFDKIKEAVVLNLMSCEPDINANLDKIPGYRNNCFETYGFDVMIDDELNAKVLEVNVSHNLTPCR